MANLSPDWPGLANVVLTRGSHQDNTPAWCFAEACAQHAFATKGEDFDIGGISLVLRQTGQRVNDGVDDIVRQLLKVSIQAVVDSTSADAALEKRRQYKILDAYARSYFPAWLDFVGYQSDATRMRNLAPVTSTATATAASVAMRSIRVILKTALASKQAVVGPPTQFSYRAYNAIIDSGGLAFALASDLPAEYLIRRSDSLQGNVDRSTAEINVFGTNTLRQGGFYSTLGTLAVAGFRQAVAAT